MTVPVLFDTVVHAVALWGYVALLLTGQLPVAVVGTTGLLVFPAWFFNRRGWHFSPLWTNVLTLAALGVAAVIGSHNLLDAGLYFIMFLQLLKLYGKRSAVDNMWVFLVCFFQVVGAAVLTSSVGFAVVFAVYVLLMSAGLILYTIEHGYDMHLQTAAANLQPDQPTPKPRSENTRKWTNALRAQSKPVSTNPGFLWSLVPISFIVLMVAGMFFMVFPRLSTQRLFDGAPPRVQPQSMSAFEESIEFGAFQKIQLDSTVALYVRPLTFPRPQFLRLRGVALDTFDGRKWTRTSNSRPGEPLYFQITRRKYTNESHYLMIQPPGITNYLFADTLPERMLLSSHIQYVFDPLSQSALLVHPLRKQFEYTAVSRREPLEDRIDPEKLPQIAADGHSEQPAKTNSPERALAGLAKGVAGLFKESPAPAKPGQSKYRTDRFLMPVNPYNRAQLQRHAMQVRYVQKCTQLPAQLATPVLSNLAAEWTREAATSFDKALAIETRLRTQYQYSLDHKAKGNYIEDFLLRSKEGHCEYFATSMVVLLRNLAIPARVVNGFYSVEWNEMAKVYTVRQRDAHSWVEVYFDNYGWMTFDPTPASGVGRPVPFSAFMTAIERIVDTCKVRWYRHVIDFSFSDQVGYLRDLHAAITELLEALNTDAWIRIDFLATDTGEASPWFSLTLMASGAALLAVLAVILVRSLRKRRWRLGGKRTRSVPFYDAIIKHLAKLGHQRASSETPREFARRVAAMPGLEPFDSITEIYYQCRYRGDTLTQPQVTTIRQFTTNIARQQRHPRPANSG